MIQIGQVAVWWTNVDWRINVSYKNSEGETFTENLDLDLDKQNPSPLTAIEEKLAYIGVIGDWSFKDDMLWKAPVFARPVELELYYDDGRASGSPGWLLVASNINKLGVEDITLGTVDPDAYDEARIEADEIINAAYQMERVVIS